MAFFDAKPVPSGPIVTFPAVAMPLRFPRSLPIKLAVMGILSWRSGVLTFSLA